MFFSRLILLILACNHFFGIQAEMTIEIISTYCDFYDLKYFQDVEVGKVDSISSSINMTIVDHLPAESDIHFYVLGESEGKYVLPTGFDITSTFCDVLDEPIIVGPIWKNIGFNDCPPKLGVYGSERIPLNIKAYPDAFPPNNYLSVVEILDGDKVLLKISTDYTML